MKQFLPIFSFFICFPFFSFAQSIFSNGIDGVNTNAFNPYVIGQIVDPNITVSGIGRAIGMFGVNAHNRYDAKSWKVSASDPDTFFEFTLVPNADYKIDFVSFVFTGQTSDFGPTRFAFRSSIDGFTSDIGLVTDTGATVSLAEQDFQNVTSPITFRLYGWDAAAGTGTFSVNDFQFNGIVSCLTPETPVLPEISLGCSSTSFVLNWPASLHASNYFIDVAKDFGFVNNLAGYQNKVLGNALIETVEGLNKGGTYYVRIKSGNSCGESTYSNSIKVAPPETVYNGSWSNGIPDISKQARFSKDFNLDADLEACSCHIDNGVAVHVDSGVVLRLENELDVQGLGTLTFENNASLIQTNPAMNINSGKIIYRRVSQPMKALDYTYWASPVSGQTLGSLAPLSPPDKLFSWGTTYWVSETPATDMAVGRGYIIRAPKTGVTFPYSQPVQFVGTPNNGDYVLTTGINVAGRQNLIGNPYPSAVSADAFLQENCFDHKRLNGTIYFWTHNTAYSGGKYVSADYAAYNFTGGVGTYGSGTSAPNTGLNNTAPLGFIAAGQSFLVLSKGDEAGTVVFKNSMRISSTGEALNNSNFFRGTKSKTATAEKHRIWLNLTNSEGAFKQILVGYVKGATSGYDSVFDGESFGGNSFVDFYSINENKNLTIQGRALPFDVKDQVPLGYKSTIDGTFEISIDHIDGNLDNQPIFVEDKVTKVVHNLKNGAYSFVTSKGTFNDRFVLLYSDKVLVEAFLGDSIFDEKQKKLVVFVKNHKIKINSFDEDMNALMVYDLKGSLLYEKKQINDTEFTISSLDCSNQLLIVKIKLSNGKWVTKEIVY